MINNEIMSFDEMKYGNMAPTMMENEEEYVPYEPVTMAPSEPMVEQNVMVESEPMVMAPSEPVVMAPSEHVSVQAIPSDNVGIIINNAVNEYPNKGYNDPAYINAMAEFNGKVNMLGELKQKLEFIEMVDKETAKVVSKNAKLDEIINGINVYLNSRNMI